MNRIAIISGLLAFGMLMAAGEGRAQAALEPIHSDLAMANATIVAKQALGADAEMVLIGALGDAVVTTPVGPMRLRFDPGTGTSSAWAYVFNSPSKGERATVVGLKIPGMGIQAFESESPVPVPAQISTKLDPGLSYGTSHRMIERLGANAVYRGYRDEFPNVPPRLVSYREVLSSDTLLPDTFPIDAPVWVVEFSWTPAREMTCYVAGSTGETICLRSSVAGVEGDNGAEKNVTMKVMSGESGRLRVAVAPASGGAGEIDAALYNTAGERVMEPSGLIRSAGGWTVEFDTESLAAGFYYCRANGDGWSGTAGAVKK